MRQKANMYMYVLSGTCDLSPFIFVLSPCRLLLTGNELSMTLERGVT